MEHPVDPSPQLIQHIQDTAFDGLPSSSLSSDLTLLQKPIQQFAVLLTGKQQDLQKFLDEQASGYVALVRHDESASWRLGTGKSIVATYVSDTTILLTFDCTDMQAKIFSSTLKKVGCLSPTRSCFWSSPSTHVSAP